MKNQEAIKIQLQEKVHRRTCVRDIIFLIARRPSYVIFSSFLCLVPTLPYPYPCLLNGHYKDT